MDFIVWLTIGIPSLVTIIGFVINFKIINASLKNELKKHKENKVYDRKVEAIMDTLYLLDSYISWLNISSNGVVPEREQKTPIELTVSLRKCYNELCVTCVDRELLKTLLLIFFPENDTNIFQTYNDFRNKARKELGLTNDIAFDRHRTFFANIRPEGMADKEK